jgi:hypothetical protein
LCNIPSEAHHNVKVSFLLGSQQFIHSTSDPQVKSSGTEGEKQLMSPLTGKAVLRIPASLWLLLFSFLGLGI